MMTTMKKQAFRILALLAVLGLAGPALSAGQPADQSADQSELDTLIRTRIAIGEMMMDYFKERGGMSFGGGERPSPEQMHKMREDITTRLTEVLSPYGMTVDEYRTRSREVLADEDAVRRHLEAHPDLKQRYDALPMDQRGRGGSGRGY